MSPEKESVMSEIVQHTPEMEIRGENEGQGEGPRRTSSCRRA